MDVQGVAAAVALATSAFDGLRTIIGLVKDVQGVLPEGEKRDAIQLATAQVEEQALLAEVQLAEALGYPLCRCQFPPTPMLKVGSAYIPPHGKSKPEFRYVHQCPKCKQNDVHQGQGRITWDPKIPD